MTTQCRAMPLSPIFNQKYQMEIILLVLVVSAYFLPFLIAFARSHHNSLAIFVLVLVLGWTLIGWLAALVWAFTSVNRTARLT